LSRRVAAASLTRKRLRGAASWVPPGLDPLDRDAVEAIIDRDSLALLQLS